MAAVKARVPVSDSILNPVRRFQNPACWNCFIEKIMKKVIILIFC
jgi:hypothetical protein